MTKGDSEVRHVIVGTAGHIDHGKTALVKALTGIDADTLAEEKRRGITIELGFIFMETPGYDKQIVFIDVPGHERLVRTMVAGASNIDAALLVIAADEGIMPQTVEHFDILQLLEIQRGFIALTKSDLVDEKRIQELKSEVGNFVKGTFLENAPIIPVSSMNGEGVDEVRSVLMNIGKSVEERRDSGIFRMPVDRVFTMRGFGTVIAGTVLSGEVKTGDKIEIFPDGLLTRVRGVQVHHTKTEHSIIGKRTALNIPDIKKEKLRRGQCAGLPGSLTPTNRIDGKLYLLKSYGKDLKNRSRVRFHTGTAEIICRLVLLDQDKLSPGESAIVQFVLEAPTVALPSDRFVIRSFSPLMTIGGGRILDPTPLKHKRFDPQTLEGVKRLEGDIHDVVEQMFVKTGASPQSSSEVASEIGEQENVVAEAISRIYEEEKLVKIASEKKEAYLHKKSYEDLEKKLISLIENYFKENPHRLFMPYVDLRSQFLRLSDPQTFKTIVEDLTRKNIIYQKDSNVGLVGYEIKMKPRDQELALKIEEIFKKAAFAVPLEEDVRQELGLDRGAFKNIMKNLMDKESLIRLNQKVTYHRETVERAQRIVMDLIKRNQSITIAELRNELQLSRKYAQAILEYLDSVGLTKRVEDKHIIN
jgi:selenocysteine-specific elongation factor